MARISCALLLVGVFLLPTTNNVTADIIVAGDDLFISSGQFRVQVFGGFTEVVSLNSASTMGMVHRDAQVGDNPGTINTEMVAFDLFGASTNVGVLHLRVGTSKGVVEGGSFGQITNVFTMPGSSDPSAFISGASSFNLFFEIDATGSTFYNNTPYAIGQQPILSLPPNVTHTSASIVPLFEDIGVIGDHNDDVQVGFVGPFSITIGVPLAVTRGTYVSGAETDLAGSDNMDLSLRRSNADLQSRTEFEVKSFSSIANPTSFEFTLEGSVFARGNVVQTIELFDYDLGAWELVDASNANRAPMPDKVVTATPTGDLSRFVEAGTMCIEARVRYKSDRNRQNFASNTDQAVWTIE